MSDEHRRSGFVREMGFLDVLVFNVAGYSLGLALVTNPPFIGGFAPTADLQTVVVLGALVALLNGYVYAAFAAAMPRTGGEYVYVGRTLALWLGFVASWGFTVTQALGLAVNLGWTVNIALAPLVDNLTFALGASRSHELASTLATPTAAFWGGFILLLLLAPAVRLSQRVVRPIILTLVAIGLVGPLLIGYAFLTTSHTEFVGLWNSLAASRQSPGTYQEILRLAAAAGINPDAPLSLAESFRATPIGFLVFLGFSYSVYRGSEVREPSRNQSLGIGVALLIGVMVFVVIMGAFQSTVGGSFNAALSLPDAAAVSPVLPGTAVSSLAALCLDNDVLRIAMFLGILCWFILIPFVMMVVIGRNLVGWSLDHLAPARWSGDTGVTGSGIVATILGTVALLGVTWLLGVSLVAATASISISYGLTALAATAFPFRRPDLFQKAPAFVKQRFLELPIISIVGFISAVSFVAIGYFSFKSPMIVGLTDKRAVGIVIGMYGTGLLWYLYFRYRHRLELARTHTGVTADDLLRELPPLPPE